MLNVVLYHPEIANNTGTIGRTCVLTKTKLHLIEPLGFSLEDKAIRRSGMGYWKNLVLYTYSNFEDFMLKNALNKSSRNLFFFSKYANKNYAQVSYPDDSYLVFGSESHGIDAKILDEYKEMCVRIPILQEQGMSPATATISDNGQLDAPQALCLNLSNSANIAMYEAMRQHDFYGIK
ncbi:MAG: tRNA (cytidine(34)-2'-O)-methyltransferase [Coriobacteriales bacterium]|nr:tRNA (cytidine(34)-2'-O)-methyltransferase [Coriobacteriales bacterium]